MLRSPFLFPTSSDNCFQVCATCQHKEMKALFIQPGVKAYSTEKQPRGLLPGGWFKLMRESSCQLWMWTWSRRHLCSPECAGEGIRCVQTHLSRTRIELAMFLLFRELRRRTKTEFYKPFTTHILFIRAFSFCLLFPDILRELIIGMKGHWTRANISSLVLKAMMQRPQRSFRLRPVFIRWFYTCQTIQTLVDVCVGPFWGRLWMETRIDDTTHDKQASCLFGEGEYIPSLYLSNLTSPTVLTPPAYNNNMSSPENWSERLDSDE